MEEPLAKAKVSAKAKGKAVGAKPKGPAAIEAKGLVKKYGDLVALSPLNLRIEKGERVCLVGSNGSGKTTFLKMAAGLLEKSGGEVTVFDDPAGSIDARARISYLPDEPVLYDDLSVREHIAYLGPLSGADDWDVRGEDLLKRLKLDHRGDDLPSGFSRGLRQKTSLAIGFTRPFDILLIDEPFVGLDEPGRQALLGLLDEAGERGATVVVASHQLDLLKWSNRCVGLSDGKVSYDGSPEGVDLVKLVGA